MNKIFWAVAVVASAGAAIFVRRRQRRLREEAEIQRIRPAPRTRAPFPPK